jgi:hypothetical protein
MKIIQKQTLGFYKMQIWVRYTRLLHVVQSLVDTLEDFKMYWKNCNINLLEFQNGTLIEKNMW